MTNGKLIIPEGSYCMVNFSQYKNTIYVVDKTEGGYYALYSLDWEEKCISSLSGIYWNSIIPYHLQRADLCIIDGKFGKQYEIRIIKIYSNRIGENYVVFMPIKLLHTKEMLQTLKVSSAGNGMSCRLEYFNEILKEINSYERD